MNPRSFFRRSVTLMAVALAGMASKASAQSIELAGSTSGCFYTTVQCEPTGGDQVMFLKFVSGTFDQTTSTGGFGVIGSGGISGSNLGYFQLGNTPDVYSGEKFLLKILFESPLLLGPNAVYTAAVVGTVTNDGSVTGGGVNIQFGPAQTFAFDGPDYAGSFTMKVNNLSVSPGTLESNGGVPISAVIMTNVSGPVTATPEPATLALFATGLVGLVPIIRRRRL